MVRIGILGAENSHADAFIKLFNEDVIAEGFKVVAIGGYDKHASEKAFNTYNLEHHIDDPVEMTKYVDAVMVTARDGKYHAQMAMPFIKKGIPAFIDKPFTVSPRQSAEIIAEAKKSGALVSGGSSVKLAYDVLMLANIVETQDKNIKGGSVTAPLSMYNEYSGFYFYSSHLAEMSMRIFGYKPNAVTAIENNDSVTVIAEYDKYCVSNHFNNGASAYSAAVYTDNRAYQREVDISLCYKHECDEFVHMIKSGKMPISYEKLAAPVFYLNAVEKSFKEKRTIEIDYLDI